MSSRGMMRPSRSIIQSASLLWEEYQFPGERLQNESRRHEKNVDEVEVEIEVEVEVELTSNLGMKSWHEARMESSAISTRFCLLA